MRRLVLVCLTLVVFVGCDQGEPDARPLPAGTEATIVVPEKAEPQAAVMFLEFNAELDKPASCPLILPATRVKVLDDPIYRESPHYSLPKQGDRWFRRVQVEILDGEERDRRGYIHRFHLKP